MNDKKVPQFFIPASYKGHQTSPASVPPANLLSQIHSSNTDTKGQRNPRSQSSDETRPISPTVSRATFANGKPGDLKSPLLFPSPTGTLDLSHYNFVPTQTINNKDSKSKRPNGGLSSQALVTNNRLNNTLDNNNNDVNNGDLIDSSQTGGGNGEKEKKRRRFRRPRKNSKLDRLIRFLEDKRVKDDGNGEELEDLQMPKLRKVLNIIFVTLGVCFLLAVIIVILYTTIAGDTDALKDLCHHRSKLSSGCDNQTDPEHLEFEHEEPLMSTTINTYIPPQSPLVSEGTEKFQLMHTSPENEQPKPLSPSNIYNMPVLQSPLDVSISQIDGTNEAVTRGPLPPPPDIYSYIDTFDDIYLTPTNNEGNYPWSHKLYNNPPKVEQMTNLQKHENLPTNSGRQIDQNSIWSESWIPKFQHTAVNHAIQVNNHKKTIKKV